MNHTEKLQIVWFKRDLRIDDHEPLIMAAKCRPVIQLFKAELELWQQPDMSCRRRDFVRERLGELREGTE